jgi:4-hydroxybenzoate polyprenyltransferase
VRTADLVRLLRPWQWYKNLVVVIALLFSNNVLQTRLYLPVLATFLAFCALASGHYAWNDVRDRDADARHPKKRLRPVASGAVPVGVALALGASLTLLGILILLEFTNPATLFFGLCYVLLQLAYTFWLKQVALLDLLVIGIGFVLRAIAGTTAIDVGDPTPWLILMTFLFALFLGLAKRRHELQLVDAAQGTTRTSLQSYPLAYTEQITNITAGLLLTSYFLYTIFGPTAWMMLTIPFAVYGVLRYLLLAHQQDGRDEAQMLFQDPGLIVAAIAWALIVVLVLRDIPQDAFRWLEGLAP